MGLLLSPVLFSVAAFLILLKVSGTAVNILSFVFSTQMDYFFFFKVSNNNYLNFLLEFSCLAELRYKCMGWFVSRFNTV